MSSVATAAPAGRLASFENGFVAANRWLVGALLAAMAIIVFANVVLRYATSDSIEWAEEVARQLMVWLTFVGSGLVLRYGGHIAVENLQDAMPSRGAQLMRAAVALGLFGLFGFMLWYGTVYALRAVDQLTPTTQISMAWIYAAIPVGAVLLLLHWALVVRRYVVAREFPADPHFDANASASL